MSNRKSLKHKSSYRAKFSRQQVSTTVANFESPLALVKQSDVSKGVITKCLVFVEGTHTDVNDRVFAYPKERIERLVTNSNKHLSSGGTVPVLFDHIKTVDNTAGMVAAPFTSKVITARDLDAMGSPQLTGLIGKLGVFCNKVALRSSKAVTSFSDNIVRTISPGIDFVGDVIREVSIVPIPAITGLSLFAKSYGQPSSASEYADMYEAYQEQYVDNLNLAKFEDSYEGEEENKPNYDRYSHPKDKALILGDLLASNDTIDQYRPEVDDIYESLWQVLSNIYNADVSILGDADPAKLMYQALDDFADKAAEVMGLPDLGALEEEGANTYGSPGYAYMPEYLKQQQQLQKNSTTAPRGKGNLFTSNIGSKLASYSKV